MNNYSQNCDLIAYLENYKLIKTSSVDRPFKLHITRKWTNMADDDCNELSTLQWVWINCNDLVEENKEKKLQ